ncbi:MAG: hypothetical protein M4D80_34700 [Myxococcota bacterium]|nr:hypothetical protein [Myxococcota bacterium]
MRAETIAVQHAQEALPRFGETARREQLARTETMLQFQLASRLWGVLGETIYDEQTQHYLCDLIDARWRCGFLRSARIRNHDDYVFGELVRGLHDLPIAIVLRELVVTDVRPVVLGIVTNRTWPSLETFTIDGGRLDAAKVAEMLARLPKLRHLSVWGTENSDVLCEAIAASPIVSQLESIDLRQGAFTRVGIDALSTAKLDSLQTLELGATPIDTHARLQHLAPTVRVHPDG